MCRRGVTIRSCCYGQAKNFVFRGAVRVYMRGGELKEAERERESEREIAFI